MIISIIIVFVVLAYTLLVLLLPLPALKSSFNSTTLHIKIPPANLSWPSYGEAAVGLIDSGVLQTNGNQKPLPTASVAKLITALSVLNKYPLSTGEQGPFITIDATDYNYYTTYVSEQGSVVPVYAGEQLSEYQMLEAMLIPSGNNIADSLARWAFGSISNYTAYANNYVKHMGMNNTYVSGDASGFLPSTTSTANDLIILGAKVMANPVLKQIVGLKSVDIPNVGVMKNYDNILGSDGFIGIKTGNNNQDPGVFLGALSVNIKGVSETLLTAVMGAPSLETALTSTLPLAISLQSNFKDTILINKGDVLGSYTQPWGGTIQAVSKSDFSLFAFPGQTISLKLKLNPLKMPVKVGVVVGNVSLQTNQFNTASMGSVVTESVTTNPSIAWRFTHPLSIL